MIKIEDIFTCKKCGKTLPVERMSKGWKNVCKKCESDYQIARRKANPDKYAKRNKDACKRYYWEHREKSREYNKKYREEHKEELLQHYKDKYQHNKERILESQKKRRNEFNSKYKTPCIKCGEKRLLVIEFHHIDPSKKLFTIGDSITRGDEEIKKEIQKCVCLCCNCHREFHYTYGKKPQNPVESLKEYLGGDFNAEF